MGSTNVKTQARLKRKQRIRRKVVGTSERPRLSVFRSSKHIYAQVINDADGRTLAAASTMEKDLRDKTDFENKVSKAFYIGKLVAERAKVKGVSKVVFDRNGFMYHGRVKALSDGAREGGLNF
jgi:large subunit ribosomal protein L18